ncbi:MAG TPA: hypothetical protein VMS81_06835 [Methanomicrobiales archaeon]|nr:hypothetical protein [Methanomicrobiales archaeon]
MPKRLLLGRLFIIAFAILILLGAGYFILSRPVAVYPSIHPVEVAGGTYRDVGIDFTFEGAARSITIPVNGTVYFGAQRAQKQAILTKEVPDSTFIPTYYLAFLNDPNQEEFFQELTGAFRAIRVKESLDDDEYLELLAVSVQSLPYENDGTLTAPKFPIETYVDGKGDCDDKSLLLAGLLAREGYSVALFYFKPEAHMAVGVKGYRCDYRGTGYGYVGTTNLSFVGVAITHLAGGVELVSAPLVIPVANGTRLYGQCQETAAIENAVERTKSRADSLSRDLASLQQKMNDLRSQGRYAEYNSLVDQYGSLVKDYNTNADAHNYILEHQSDRKGTYAWLKARALV